MFTLDYLIYTTCLCLIIHASTTNVSLYRVSLLCTIISELMISYSTWQAAQLKLINFGFSFCLQRMSCERTRGRLEANGPHGTNTKFFSTYNVSEPPPFPAPNNESELTDFRPRKQIAKRAISQKSHTALSVL